MGLEDVLSTKDLQSNLDALPVRLPGQDQVVYEFGKYLGERIANQPDINPQGFYLAAQLALYDLQRGVDGFTNEPIVRHKLTGYPSQIYDLLSSYITIIADATCHQEFAKGVKEMDRAVNTQSSVPENKKTPRARSKTTKKK